MMRRPARTARSGSSSCAVGAPNSASRPSPAYSKTSPPNASTAAPIWATAPPTSVLKSSGSSRSPRAVEPTTSLKSAVTTRLVSRAGPAVGAPHDEQKLEPLVEAIDAVAPTGLLLAPSDRGADHPDHALVRDAALALRDRGRDVALYADLPHATRNGLPRSWRLSLNGTASATEKIEPEVRRLSPEEATRKREAFERYRTQHAAL